MSGKLKMLFLADDWQSWWQKDGEFFLAKNLGSQKLASFCIGENKPASENAAVGLARKKKAYELHRGPKMDRWTAEGDAHLWPQKDRLSQYITLFGLRSCCSHERSFRLFSWTTPPPSNFDLDTDCAYHPLQISSCRHRMWCSLGAWRTIGNQKCQWYRWFAKVETEIYNIYIW